MGEGLSYNQNSSAFSSPKISREPVLLHVFFSQNGANAGLHFFSVGSIFAFNSNLFHAPSGNRLPPTEEAACRE
jgi:hypothetical protein